MVFELARRSGELDVCRGRLSSADDLLPQSQAENATLSDQVTALNKQVSVSGFELSQGRRCN